MVHTNSIVSHKAHRVLGLSLIFGLFLFAISACTSDSESSPETTSPIAALNPELRTAETQVIVAESARADTLVWLHDQEPLSLHADSPENFGTSTALWVQQGLLEGLFGVDKDLGYYPELLVDVPTRNITNTGRVILTYKLRDGLRWSDGEPLTADDVAYTHRIITQDCEKESDGSIIDGSSEGCVFEMETRRGYDLVTDLTVVSDTEFTISLSGKYPNWKRLYPRIFAEHAFGADAAAVNANLKKFATGNGVLPSSGPLTFKSWIRGDQINLGTNSSYHGSTNPNVVNKGAPNISNFQVLFLPNAESIIQSMRAGAGHFVMTDVDVEYLDLAADENITPAASGGPLYEHLSMNLTNVHLDKARVREAIAYAIDKPAIMSAIYTPIYGDILPSEGLGNSFWMPQQTHYEDNQIKYAGSNPTAAQALLNEAGYTLNAEGFYTHPTDGDLALRFMTIESDPFREGQQQIIKEQLESLGIKIEVDNLVGSRFYETTNAANGPFATKQGWDLTLFSWLGGPWPGGQSSAYGGKAASNSVNNIYDFNSPDFDDKARDCDLLMDAPDQGECYKELDKFATSLDGEGDGVFIIPISQKPPIYMYRSDLISSGTVISHDSGGPFIHAGDYSFS